MEKEKQIKFSKKNLRIAKFKKQIKELNEDQKSKGFNFKKTTEGQIYRDSEGNVFPEASLLDIDDGMMIEHRHLMRN